VSNQDVILTRRSIRRYTAEPVSEEQVTKLMEYAMSAPSADNQQPWVFVVVADRGILDELGKRHQAASMLSEAPLAIVVCCDMDRVTWKQFWQQDCAAATENVLLGANSLGLGAVWCGVYPVDAMVAMVRSVLGLPQSVIPFSLIPVGHPLEHKPPSDRYDPSRVHLNHW
jgi:nitroreductase